MHSTRSYRNPSFSIVKVRTISNIVEMMIGEMKKNRLLWDLTLHPELRPKRLTALLEISKKTGLTVAKLSKLITYVKSQYVNEYRKMQTHKKEGTQIKKKWKWYSACSFLEDLRDLRNQQDLTPNDSLNFLENMNQPDSQEASSSSTITLKSFPNIKTERSEDNQPHSSNQDSTNEIFITCKTEEDENLDSLHFQADSAVDVLSPEEEPESEEEDPVARKPSFARLSNAKRKFIIDGVCSSVSFQLSNEELQEEDLVAFHSDLITYMHSYFNKKRKK